MTVSCSSSSRWSSSWSGWSGPGVSRPNSEPGRRVAAPPAGQRRARSPARRRTGWAGCRGRPGRRTTCARRATSSARGAAPRSPGTRQKTKPPGERRMVTSSYGDGATVAPSVVASAAAARRVVDVQVEVDPRRSVGQPLDPEVVGPGLAAPASRTARRARAVVRRASPVTSDQNVAPASWVRRGSRGRLQPAGGHALTGAQSLAAAVGRRRPVGVAAGPVQHRAGRRHLDVVALDLAGPVDEQREPLRLAAAGRPA